MSKLYQSCCFISDHLHIYLGGISGKVSWGWFLITFLGWQSKVDFCWDIPGYVSGAVFLEKGNVPIQLFPWTIFDHTFLTAHLL